MNNIERLVRDIVRWEDDDIDQMRLLHTLFAGVLHRMFDAGAPLAEVYTSVDAVHELWVYNRRARK